MNNKINSKLHTAFWLLTSCIVMLLTLATLIKQGMFMDAMLYTSVSHNLSQGLGTFWFPYFDAYNIANLSSFHEQPPLVFGIQSIFFKLLGSSMYVERFYTFLTLCITAFLIYLLWKEITKDNDKLKPFAWLAILLWITIPVCFWSYSNNMNENTMGIFTLSAVWMSYKALQSNENKYYFFIAAALCIAFAVLSKGFPGFFPIGVPFLYWLVTREKSFGQIVKYTILILGVLLVIGICLYYYPPSNKSLSIYFYERAFQRINDAPTVENRFFIVWRLLSELIPVLIFTALFFAIAQRKKINTAFNIHKKQAFFFIAVGVSGSLPLMLTMVQNGFYFVPSLPYFGIGFALLTAPIVESLLSKIKLQYTKYFLIVGISLFIASMIFTFFQKNKYSRDKDLLHDVTLIASVVPKNTRINCNHQTYQNWTLNCYMVRNYGISINSISIDSTDRKYFLREINSPLADTTIFDEIKLNMMNYKIYEMQ